MNEKNYINLAKELAMLVKQLLKENEALTKELKELKEQNQKES